MIFHKENIKSNLFHFYALKGDWNVYNSIKDNSTDNYPNLLSVFDDLDYSPLFYAFLGGNLLIINDIISYGNIYFNKNDKKLNIPWHKNNNIISIILYSQNIEIFKFYLSHTNLNNTNLKNIIYAIITNINQNLSQHYYEYLIYYAKKQSIIFDINSHYLDDKGANILYYCILHEQKYIFEKMFEIYMSENDNNITHPFSFLCFNLKFYTLSEKFRFNKNRVYFIHNLIYKYDVNFINKPNKNCNNLTNIAIEIFDEELLRLLISCGVNTLEKNNIGNTCLHTCVKNGSIYAYKILLDFFSYSTLNLKNDNNETIYDNANIFFKDILSSRFKDIIKHTEQKLI